MGWLCVKGGGRGSWVYGCKLNQCDHQLQVFYPNNDFCQDVYQGEASCEYNTSPRAGKIAGSSTCSQITISTQNR